MSRTRFVIHRLAWIAPGLVIGLVWIWRASWVVGGERRYTLFDDALISLSYARTLADTGELVWFPGADRVEGITNPLWTLYMSLIHLLGFSESQIILVVSVTGLLTVLASALIAGRLALRITPSAKWVEPASVLVVSLSFPALFWSIRGMEVGLQLLLASSLLLLIARSISQLAISASTLTFIVVITALGVWTRLDFLVIVLALAAWLLVSTRKRDPGWLLALTLVLAGAAAFVVQAAWRWAYYGYLLPNTYYLKVEGHDLIDRILRGQWTDGKLPLLIAVLVLSALVFGSFKNRRDDSFLIAGMLLTVSVALVAYSTYVGGDAWDELTVPNRYVVPAFAFGAVLFLTATAMMLSRGVRWYFIVGPLLAGGLFVVLGLRALLRGSIQLDDSIPGVAVVALLVATGIAVLIATYWILLWKAGLSRSGESKETAVRIVAVTLSVLLSGSLSWVSVAMNGGPKVDADQRYAEYGLVLRESLLPGTSVAVTFAGAPVYFSGLTSIDLLGKNDPVIARMQPVLGFKPGHDKFDYEYSIGVLRPDVIMQLFVASAEDYAYIEGLGYRYCGLNPSDQLPALGVWIQEDANVLRSGVSCSP